MANPYQGRPDYTYWRQGVSELRWDHIDPVTRVPFQINPTDRIATAGSCFAQHLSQVLQQQGFNYLVTEEFADHDGTTDEGYGVFPARFGNLYTTAQLLQLVDRAYGAFTPEDHWFRLRNGAFIDPFRPRIQSLGFPSVELLELDRSRHLAAVRQMFEQCDVFIFTLGLTEYWSSLVDGAVFPMAPGAVSDDIKADRYQFGNFTASQMVAHLTQFLDKLRQVNPKVRVLLTVSPVSLIATYEDRHVLVSTIASKSALRATADEICRGDPGIAYFPSYEIVTGPHMAGRLFAEDSRDVSPAGVAHVMKIFCKHFLDRSHQESLGSPEQAGLNQQDDPANDTGDLAEPAGLPTNAALSSNRIVCEESTLLTGTGELSPSAVPAECYGSRPYQPFFGFGDFHAVSNQREMEDRGAITAGYGFEDGHYFWKPTSEYAPANVGDFLFEHYLSRYRSEDVEAVDSTRRLFVLGASAAVGSAASKTEHAWHAVLERSLGGQFVSWAPLVFNCAMGAFTSFQELLALTLVVLPRRPAGVIFLNGLNDINQPWIYGTRPGDPYNLSTAMKYWYERPVIHSQNDAQGQEGLVRHMYSLLDDRDKRETVKRSIVNVYVGNMTRCIDLCRASDVKVAVCFEPWLDMSRRRFGLESTAGALTDVMAETYELIRQRMTALHGQVFHDLTGVLTHPDELEWFVDSSHFDNRGQERLGQAMAKIVGEWAKPDLPPGMKSNALAGAV